MYEGSKTVVGCVQVTYRFKVGVELHQGSALRPLLVAVVMSRLTGEVSQRGKAVSVWTCVEEG